MNMKMPVKIPDIAVIFFALALTGFSAYSAYLTPQKTARVRIEGSGREWVFPLDAEETVTIPGPLGNTIIAIHGNEARVEYSPCANQICVAQGSVSRQGGWAACLPNGVFLIIEGEEGLQNEFDAMAW